MIAIFGIIPAILIGIIFFIINPIWSAMWLLLLASSAAFILNGRKRRRQKNEC